MAQMTYLSCSGLNNSIPPSTDIRYKYHNSRYSDERKTLKLLCLWIVRNVQPILGTFQDISLFEKPPQNTIKSTSSNVSRPLIRSVIMTSFTSKPARYICNHFALTITYPFTYDSSFNSCWLSTINIYTITCKCTLKFFVIDLSIGCFL